MLIAQWMPGDGEHVGPISTGPAVVLIGVGGAVVLTAGVVALLSRREPGSGRLINWLFGLGLTMCVLGGLGLAAHHFEDRGANGGLHAAGRQNIGSALSGAELRHWRAGTHLRLPARVEARWRNHIQIVVMQHVAA
ncbi:hypothetical protein ACQ4WX_28440 [Streptomyces lasalocidi]